MSILHGFYGETVYNCNNFRRFLRSNRLKNTTRKKDSGRTKVVAKSAYVLAESVLRGHVVAKTSYGNTFSEDFVVAKVFFFVQIFT